MAKTEKIFKVRDLRRKDKYSIDDEYLNGYAKLCGVNATAVYNSLCRHASKEQECFPSLELIMEQHAFGSKHTVIKAIKKLVEWGIVSVKKERDEKTKRQKNNVYILCDKSGWKLKPGAPDAPRAECISDTDPGAFEALKPGAPDALEGDTQPKDTQLRNVAPPNGDPTDGPKDSPDKKDRPMNLTQFVEWCAKSPHGHIKIIGEWAETMTPEFVTVAQWEAYIKRNLRPAKVLVAFSHEQLEKGFERIKEAKREGWLSIATMETLFKFVTSGKLK